MRYLDDAVVDFLVDPDDDMPLQEAIDQIANRLNSIGGKARIASIPLGRRSVFGTYRHDPTWREDVTLLIVSDETRPLARAELFMHTRRVEDGEADGPEMLSRSDEQRPRHLLLDDGYPDDEQ